MGKHEAPPFKMVIEGGRLVPATPYDAERLDTYRRGTKVNVRFTEEKDRVLVRKWWAVLGLVVKQCDVPWQNKEQASEAIKLALGIVNLTKTVGGDFMAYPKSLTELDDPELQEAVEQMMALIQRMTGIDPETLRKEAAHVGEDEQEPASESPSSEAEGSAAAHPHSPAGAPDLSAESGTEEGARDSLTPVETADSPAVAPSSATLHEAEWLKTFARAIVASIGPDEEVVVNQSKGFFRDDLSQGARDKARSITKYARQVCRGELDDATEIIARIAGCEPADIAADATRRLL